MEMDDITYWFHRSQVVGAGNLISHKNPNWLIPIGCFT